MEQYKLLTVTHKRVPLTRLDRFFLVRSGDESVRDARLLALKEQFGLSGLVYLQTCNRVVYLFTRPGALDQDLMQSFWSWINPDLDLGAEDAGAVQTYEGLEAIRHLHEIAASLDSLVVGEREILRQLRQSFEHCRELNLVDDDLRLAFKFIIPAAKRIFTETRIADRPVSVVSLAARVLRDAQWVGKGRLLLVGAGQSMQTMAKFLKPMGFGSVAVFNRSLDKAQVLADQLGGHAYGLDSLQHYSGGFDVMITCTGSTDPVVLPDTFGRLLGDEPGRRLVIDLAVPADVHPDVPAQYPIQYVGMEQLRAEAESNRAFREGELEKAGALIAAFLEEFRHAWQLRQVEKQFLHIPAEVRRLRQRAVDEVFGQEIASMGQAERETLNKVLDYLEHKFASLPISKAKEAMAANLREQGMTRGSRTPLRRVAR